MPGVRHRGVCRTCQQSRVLYVGGRCSTCYRQSDHPRRPPRAIPLISPVGNGWPPLVTPTYCRVCRRPAPPAGMCLRCRQVAAYQAPPVPYYPVYAEDGR